MNKYLLLTFLILILPAVLAADDLPIYKIDAYYEIFQNNSVYTSLNLTFNRVMNSSIYYGFDHNATGVVISDGENHLNYTVIDEENSYGLNISLLRPTVALKLEYLSDGFIFVNENANLFTTTFLFNNPVIKLNMLLSLPQGAKI
ncbi:MAG: hypothetical protein NDI94_05510, partial [Candidatus Woesearchaeota archaeon]|nr:hypothetical protein [Candidatus Woesearchaeota archaeon]